ncbi:hypothetical protein HK105_205302 [Polyrhizophydium stewartii]|uniref:Uncharacterized protein n=1 Tax=Polyrhizophydium stewartii TaxID=2732419 RepID=A0ABR4N6T4_9FUNG|nr:hypothetical protein HK105_002774 [Polyrhizophydium stewartii]
MSAAIRLPDDDDIEAIGAPSSSTGFGATAGPAGSGAPPGTVRVNKFETAMPIRLDIEAALCYVLGAVSGILFLILENKNDYVRYQAYINADSLARYELPFIGSLASRWVDTE